MADINPYASPLSMDESIRSIEDLGLATLAERQEYEKGLFRKGKQLVMRHDATLPERCVKSNEPSIRYLRRKFDWTPSIVLLSLFLSPLVFAIVYFIFRRKVTIYIGLSENWFRKRRRANLIGWSLFLIGGAIFTIALACILGPPNWGTGGSWGLTIGLPLTVTGAIIQTIGSQTVTAVRITKEYIWLKGVHPDFLADLPEWPFRP
jgi:hypothetical protein